MKRNWLITNFLIGFIIVISAISFLPNFRSSAVGCGLSNPFIVQCTAVGTNGVIANSGTTSTLTNPVTAGDGLIIVGGFASGNVANTILQCSDNLAQSFTVAVHQNQNPNSGLAQDSVICYKANSVGGSDAGTVTANTVAQGLIVVGLYEVKPTLSFSGIEVTNVCQKGSATNCKYSNLGGGLGLCSPGSWAMSSTNGSLILSVFGGNPTGTDDVVMTSGFDSVDATNVNSAGDGNISQAIAQGNGSYQGECAPATGHWVSGVEAIFGPFSVTTTQTATITGFLVPNFVNGLNNFSWLYFLIVVFVPMAEIIGIITMERNSVLDRHAIIFIFLGLLLLDSIFGVMLNVVTIAMPFIFGTLFGVYLWRGRG